MEKGQWSALAFFSFLARHNKKVRELDFQVCEVSGLEGFENALQRNDACNLICISDVSDGFTELSTTPHSHRIKSVFFAMRHPVDDMRRRSECFAVMREIFRQFMSVLIREKVKLEESHIYLDSRIAFTEIERYFFTGAACSYFTVAVDVVTDLRLNPDEWIEDVSSFNSQFGIGFQCQSPASADI